MHTMHTITKTTTPMHIDIFIIFREPDSLSNSIGDERGLFEGVGEFDATGALEAFNLELLPVLDFLDEDVLAEPVLDFFELWADEPDLWDDTADPELDLWDDTADPELDLCDDTADPELDLCDDTADPELDLWEDVVAEPELDLCEDVVAEPELDLCEAVVAEPELDLCEDVVAEPELDLCEDVVADPELDLCEDDTADPELDLWEDVVAEPELDLWEEVLAELALDLWEDVAAEPELDLCEDAAAEPELDLCEEDFLEDAAEDVDSIHFFSKVNLYPLSHVSHTEFGHFAQCSIEVHLSSSEKIIPSFRNNNKINNLLVDILFF